MSQKPGQSKSFPVGMWSPGSWGLGHAGPTRGPVEGSSCSKEAPSIQSGSKGWNICSLNFLSSSFYSSPDICLVFSPRCALQGQRASSSE